MDPAVRELVNRLDDRLGHLSSQMEELRESVRQVVVVAEADPEMALTKARKVLEGVLRRVWEHFIPSEPIGTRPLEEVLQRLQKNGYLPRKQAAYAVAVKELGNVGTHVHDEKVDKADVVQALSPLISVLEWYFEQDWVEGAVPANQGGPTSPPAPGGTQKPVGPVPRPAWRPRHLIPLAVGARRDADGGHRRWIVCRVPGQNQPAECSADRPADRPFARRDRPIRPGADPRPLAGGRGAPQLEEPRLRHPSRYD